MGAKILVPRSNTVDEEHRQALLDIAAVTRPQLEWQGSAWGGAPLLAARDVLRHALLAPRLIAPHRNIGLREITAVQGIAMLMQARIADLDHIASEHSSVPTIQEARNSTDWTWRLFGALGHRLLTAEADALLLCAADAPDTAARTAATVIAVASMVEEGRLDDAVLELRNALDLDDAEPVDYAWLTVQYARCLTEIGELQQARDAAVGIQGLRRLHPDDLTAAAIEGVAAQLLFRIADFGSGDVEQAIRGADTAVAWWRQQAGANGLSAVLERSFQSWARDKTVRWSASDMANDQLLAAALTANLAGDHGDWRYLSSLLGQDQLLRLRRDGDPGAAKAGLATLRMAGAYESVKLAAIRMMGNGPALAVRLAAADIELDASTRTSVRADLDLLRFAGPVLDDKTADTTVRWILGNLNNPSSFIARTSPTFEVSSRLLDTLGAILDSASASSHAAVIDYVIALPPIKNIAWASSLANVLRHLDANAWTSATAASARDRSHDDDEMMRFPLLSIAAKFYDDTRQALLADIRSGSMDALNAFGDVRELPYDVASELIHSLAASLKQIIFDARNGHFNFGGCDFGDALTLLNLWFPDAADWATLLEMLADPFVAGSDKVIPLRRLAEQVSQIPVNQHGPLTGVLTELVRQPLPDHVSLLGKPQDIAGPAALLQAALGADPQTVASLITVLLAGDTERRAWAARLAGQRAQPEDAGLLAVLACDTEPEVRAAAALALTKIVSGQPITPVAEVAFRNALSDPGLTVPLSISKSLARIMQGELSETLQRELSRISI